MVAFPADKARVKGNVNNLVWCRQSYHQIVGKFATKPSQRHRAQMEVIKRKADQQFIASVSKTGGSGYDGKIK